MYITFHAICFCRNVKQQHGGNTDFSVAFSLTALTNELPELEMWNFVWTDIINIAENFVQSAFH
jgi:hypothetical protein